MKNVLKYEALLLLGAAIWGFAFVAQRAGMEHVGPFTYNALRFALGCLTVAPLAMHNRKRGPVCNGTTERPTRLIAVGALATGIALFIASSLQQVGLLYTTAGNAGFITGLYVVMVPILGLFWKQLPGVSTWIGALLALAGLYFLSVSGPMALLKGDLLVLLCALGFSVHILLIGRFSRQIDPCVLACLQFAVCAALSLAVAIVTEEIRLETICLATGPILYGGIMSAGVAFTIQVICQKHVPTAHASIIMSLESVFAVLGGWLILHEILTGRGLFGCALMLTGMIISQLWKQDTARQPTP